MEGTMEYIQKFTSLREICPCVTGKNLYNACARSSVALHIYIKKAIVPLSFLQ